jgi:predicted SprT family Zn-dependent metalloprotease
LSRRKDRERVEAMKRLDPDYKGFRGSRKEPNQPGAGPTEPVTCTICGRKRNVARGIALERGDSYVCVRCAEDGRVPAPAE